MPKTAQQIIQELANTRDRNHIDEALINFIRAYNQSSAMKYSLQQPYVLCEKLDEEVATVRAINIDRGPNNTNPPAADTNRILIDLSNFSGRASSHPILRGGRFVKSGKILSGRLTVEEKLQLIIDKAQEGNIQQSINLDRLADNMSGVKNFPEYARQLSYSLEKDCPELSFLVPYLDIRDQAQLAGTSSKKLSAFHPEQKPSAQPAKPLAAYAVPEKEVTR